MQNKYKKGGRIWREAGELLVDEEVTGNRGLAAGIWVGSQRNDHVHAQGVTCT